MLVPAMAFNFVHHPPCTAMEFSPEIPVKRFENIFFSTKDRLYNFVKKHTRGHDAIEEIVQQCYIKLWEQLPGLKDDENMLPMLSTYAIHLIIDGLRKEAREAVRARIFYEQQHQTYDSTDALQLKEMMKEYQEAVEALPPRRRMIYRMVREEGLSHQQIARQLNISTNTIESQINEALHTLRKKFPADKLALMMIWLNIFH